MAHSAVHLSSSSSHLFDHLLVPAGIIAEAGRKLTAQKYLAETICFEVSDGSYQVPVPVKQVTDSEHQAWAKQRIAANRRVIPDSKLKFELIRIKF